MDGKVLKRSSGNQESQLFGCRSVWVNGPVIVGAGPSGLATGACLKRHGVPFVILERSDCIASLWQHRTYHRLQLHLPKRFCQLPFLNFPPHFPQYPSKHQFLDYLDSYASLFDLRPTLGTRVLSAIHDRTSGLWRVRTAREHGAGVDQVEYICKWLVVATGENA